MIGTSTLCSFVFASTAHAASLSVSPATASHAVGDTFSVDVLVNTSQSMNGTEGTLEYPVNKLEVVGVDKSHSVMSLWVEEPQASTNGTTGSINFSAIKMNPGYSGANGNIFTVTFRVKDAGVATIQFRSGSVLANDGEGTNIVTSFGTGVYSLTRGSVLPTTPPGGSSGSSSGLSSGASLGTGTSSVFGMPVVKYWVQDAAGGDVLFTTSEDAPRWSKSGYAKLTWQLPDDATAVATAFDENPDTEPGVSSMTRATSQLLPFLPEGQHYFHIRYVRNGVEGSVLHFPVLVDVHAPQYFTIGFDGEETASDGIHTTSSPRPRLAFFTQDLESGLAKYEAKINDGDWMPVTLGTDGVFVLPKLEVQTRYDVIVRAFDLAENSVDATASFVIAPVVSPTVTYVPKNVRFAQGPLIVEGRAAPEARVEIVFVGTDAPIVMTTKADSEGEWRLVQTTAIPDGVYSVKMRQILGNGAASLYTPDVTLRVNSLLGRFLEWIAGVNWYVFLLVFIAIQIVTIYYYRRSFRRLQVKLHGRIDSVATVAHQGIAAIEKKTRRGVSPEKISDDLNALQKKIARKKRVSARPRVIRVVVPPEAPEEELPSDDV